jgi:hypothetical protein
VVSVAGSGGAGSFLRAKVAVAAYSNLAFLLNPVKVVEFDALPSPGVKHT